MFHICFWIKFYIISLVLSLSASCCLFQPLIIQTVDRKVSPLCIIQQRVRPLYFSRMTKIFISSFLTEWSDFILSYLSFSVRRSISCITNDLICISNDRHRPKLLSSKSGYSL